MKIRIKGNSIRIRLTKSEVELFGNEGYLEDRTEFGNNALIYALQRADNLTDLAAGFDGPKITMYVPTAIAHEWTTTDVVGYNNNMSIGGDKTLFLLLEKDFKCIDGEVMKDQSDNYENPLAACP